MDCVTKKFNNIEMKFIQQLMYVWIKDGGYERPKCLVC